MLKSMNHWKNANQNNSDTTSRLEGLCSKQCGDWGNYPPTLQARMQNGAAGMENRLALLQKETEDMVCNSAPR